MTKSKIPVTGIRLNARTSNTDSESRLRILKLEEVDEKIKTYIAPLIKKLQDLTRLIQGMSSVHRQSLSPRISTSADSSAAGPSRNIAIGGTGTSSDRGN